jgi:hypothetical protein
MIVVSDLADKRVMEIIDKLRAGRARARAAAPREVQKARVMQPTTTKPK